MFDIDVSPIRLPVHVFFTIMKFHNNEIHNNERTPGKTTHRYFSSRGFEAKGSHKQSLDLINLIFQFINVTFLKSSLQTASIS